MYRLLLIFLSQAAIFDVLHCLALTLPVASEAMWLSLMAMSSSTISSVLSRLDHLDRHPNPLATPQPSPQRTQRRRISTKGDTITLDNLVKAANSQAKQCKIPRDWQRCNLRCTQLEAWLLWLGWGPLLPCFKLLFIFHSLHIVSNRQNTFLSFNFATAPQTPPARRKRCGAGNGSQTGQAAEDQTDGSSRGSWGSSCGFLSL